ncbi:hypothetical protein M3J09_013570 [Ascochyta lentis]
MPRDGSWPWEELKALSSMQQLRTAGLCFRMQSNCSIRDDLVKATPESDLSPWFYRTIRAPQALSGHRTLCDPLPQPHHCSRDVLLHAQQQARLSVAGGHFPNGGLEFFKKYLIHSGATGSSEVQRDGREGSL